jgi:D-sedoheptulose 7-phosphate isomerase
MEYLNKFFIENPNLKLVFYTLVETFKTKHKLLLAGNGGSACDAEHICGELLKGFNLNRELTDIDKQKIINISNEYGKFIGNSLQYGLPVIALTSHLAYYTAFSNDVNVDNVFAQQLFVLGNENDCVIGFSTSGNSINIRNMFITAKAKKLKTILFTGNNHGECEKYADIVINTLSNITWEIQETHLKYYHALCLDLEKYFFN